MFVFSLYSLIFLFCLILNAFNLFILIIFSLLVFLYLNHSIDFLFNADSLGRGWDLRIYIFSKLPSGANAVDLDTTCRELLSTSSAQENDTNRF